MKKLTAYKAMNGALETDPIRALAWDLVYCSEKNNRRGN